jgi:hypothetical protein
LCSHCISKHHYSVAFSLLPTSIDTFKISDLVSLSSLHSSLH